MPLSLKIKNRIKSLPPRTRGQAKMIRDFAKAYDQAEKSGDFKSTDRLEEIWADAVTKDPFKV